MKEYIAHLYPRSGLEGYLTSGTLFGALCWAIRILYSEERLVEILDQFQERPVFLISSLFPFREFRGELTHCLPKPLYPPLKDQFLHNFDQYHPGLAERLVKKESYHSDRFHRVRVVQAYKAFRKLRWITEKDFSDISEAGIKGEEELFLRYLKTGVKKIQWKKDAGVRKNSLDRLSKSTGGAGNTFYTREFFLQKGFGLYFLFQTDEPDILMSALRFLEDSGIGPNTRTGKNHFKIQCVERAFTRDTKGTSFVTLSRYFQRDQDVFDFSRSWYELDFVRAKVASREEFMGRDIWKDAVAFIREGSVISLRENMEFPGEILPVRKMGEKTIYQYAFAYPYWGDFAGGTL